MKILSFLLVFYVAYNCHAISDRDLYNVNAPGSTSLQNGNEESRQIQLRTPIHFYSESYDSIFVSEGTTHVVEIKFMFKEVLPSVLC
jgi:hypothetical protein